MKRFDFLVTYDITSKKRLSKLAKLLEKNAFRIQHSIFLYDDVSKIELTILINAILKIIDEEFDDVRIYKIDISKSIHIGSGVDLSNPYLVSEE